MPDAGLLLAFAVATTALMLIPGPNVALITANSVVHGTGAGLLTVAGTASAMVIQLALVAVGMTEALGALGAWMEWVRWAGAAYLVYLGVRQWTAPPTDLTRTKPQLGSAWALYRRAFLVSLTNPKVLLFYGAFFPQFIAADRSIGPQVALLSGIFLALAIVVDSAWATAAGWARGLLAARGRLRNRVSGGLLVTAGVGLALARRP